jgi:uncharacterized protein YqgV (UPF0045/DUF77 family)
MHSKIVNATIQVVPLAQDRHPYDWVDIAIPIIQRSGIRHEVRSFCTELEGTYEEVVKVFNDVNEHLFQLKCQEWITYFNIQLRAEADITADEKTAKYQVKAQ